MISFLFWHFEQLRRLSLRLRLPRRTYLHGRVGSLHQETFRLHELARMPRYDLKNEISGFTSCILPFNNSEGHSCFKGSCNFLKHCTTTSDCPDGYSACVQPMVSRGVALSGPRRCARCSEQAHCQGGMVCGEEGK